MAADASPAPTEAGRLHRIADVLRDIARGGLAGALGGLLAGGIGGRIVMRLTAMMNPDATGLRTENGELIGAITANGTLALFVFGGLFGGAVAGVVWVVTSPWIPGTGARRALLTMPIAAALGGFTLVRASNSDFVVLGQDGPIIVMLIALVALIGGATALLDGWLDRRLPRPGSDPTLPLVGYGVIAGFGLLLFLPLTLNTYLNHGFAGRAPLEAGWALIATGAATAIWWALRIATGRADRPPALLAAGRIGLVAAILLGGRFLLEGASKILAAG